MRGWFLRARRGRTCTRSRRLEEGVVSCLCICVFVCLGGWQCVFCCVDCGIETYARERARSETRTVLARAAFQVSADRRPLQDIADVQHVGRVRDVLLRLVDDGELVHAAQGTEVISDAVDGDVLAVEATGGGDERRQDGGD